MTPKQFQQFLNRDQVCYHCGINNDTLIPQHRAGRGMGGVKSRNNAANIIVFCSYANGLLESDAKFAELGRQRGWKLNSWDDPTTTPVWDVFNACWWLLDQDGGRKLTVQPDLV